MALELLIIAATDGAGNGLFTVNNSMCLLIAKGWRQQTTGRKESENYQSMTGRLAVFFCRVLVGYLCQIALTPFVCEASF